MLMICLIYTYISIMLLEYVYFSIKYIYSINGTFKLEMSLENNNLKFWPNSRIEIGSKLMVIGKCSFLGRFSHNCLLVIATKKTLSN